MKALGHAFSFVGRLWGLRYGVVRGAVGMLGVFVVFKSHGCGLVKGVTLRFLEHNGILD